MQICRICLSADLNLYSMISLKKLSQAYEMLTGLSINTDDILSPYLCSECAQRLLNSVQFRTRSLRAHSILLAAAKKQEYITPESLASAMANQQILYSNLSVTHKTSYDLDIKHIENECDGNKIPNKYSSHLDVSNDDIKTEKDYDHRDDIGEIEYLSESKENITLKYIKVEDATDQDSHCIKKNSTVLQKHAVADVLKREIDIIDQVNTEVGNAQCDDINLGKINIADDVINQVSTVIGDVNVDNGTTVYENEYEFNEKIRLVLHEDYVDFNIKELDVTDRGIGEGTSDRARLISLREEPVECKLERDKNINKSTLNTDTLNDIATSSVKLALRIDEEYSSEDSLLSSSERQTADTSAIKLEPNVDNSPELITNKLSCDLCHYKTLHEMQLLSHLKAHAATNSFHCNMCSYKTIQKNHLILHIKTHAGEKSYSCAHCMKAFTARSALQRHLRIHSGERPYACNFCEKRFAETGSLRNHVRIHTGEKPFACKLCTRKFSERSSLRRHVRLHTGDKQHKCDICKKTFNESGGLKKHMIVHMVERKYSCDICSKSFKDKRAIQSHLTVHQQVIRVKPVRHAVSCEECGKIFSSKFLLQNHLRTHSNEKPYSCELCSKAFSYKAGLRKHSKVHTVRGEYNCESCGKVFIENDYLLKHLRLYCRGKIKI